MIYAQGCIEMQRARMINKNIKHGFFNDYKRPAISLTLMKRMNTNSNVLIKGILLYLKRLLNIFDNCTNFDQSSKYVLLIRFNTSDYKATLKIIDYQYLFI